MHCSLLDLYNDLTIYEFWSTFMEISQLMSGFDVNFVLLSADLHTLDSTSGKQPGNQNWLSIMNAYVYVKQFNHFTIK